MERMTWRLSLRLKVSSRYSVTRATPTVMATASALACSLDDEARNAVWLQLPCPAQTTGSGDSGGRCVEHCCARRINAEEGAELHVREPRGGCFRKIHA